MDSNESYSLQTYEFSAYSGWAKLYKVVGVYKKANKN